MYDTTKDIKRLKSKGWENHNKIGSGEFNSVYNVLNHYKFEVDFDVIADKCSANPNHKMFGKTVEEIREVWKQKGEVGKRRGRQLDSYIQNKLHKKPFPEMEEAMKDESMVSKFKNFDALREEVLNKSGMRPVSSELWVNSAEYKIRGKFDEIFYIDGDFNGYVLVDWKNTEDIKVDSARMMSGCLSHLPSCDLYEYYLQIYIYMFLLRTEYKINCRGGRIMQLAERKYKVLTPPEDFPYDEELIRKLLNEYNKNK